MLGSRDRRNPRHRRAPRSRLLALALLLAGLVAAALWRQPDDRGSIAGTARIVDGDSIEIAGSDIRLKGIDAPEMAQVCRRGGQPYRCGDEARRHLARLIDGEAVECRLEGRDRYRRHLGICAAAGRELNAAMVRDGWAVGYRAHADAERDARFARRGLWAGSFERPEEWRRAQSASMVGGVEEDD